MLINMLPFDLNNSTVELEVRTKRKEHGNVKSIHPDECSTLWKSNPDLANTKEVFFSITDTARECYGDSFTASIDLPRNRRLAKHIINQRLYSYFKERAIVGYDFVDNIEVWIESPQQPTPKATTYLRFSVVPKDKTVTNGWELLVSFNGHSIVYDTPLSALDLHTEKFRVIAGDEVLRYRDLTPDHKQKLESIFPVINRPLSAELQIDEHYEKIENRYTTALGYIRGFIKEYLPQGDIAGIITVTSDDLITVPEDRIDTVPKGSNVLVFADGKTSFDPYSGLFGSRGGTGFGPYRPSNLPSVKFFFIASKDDLQVCRDLYNIFSVGSRNGLQDASLYPAFKPLAQTIKQPFFTDKNGSIFFSSTENALTEIKQQLSVKELNKDTQYVAIYISPVNKDDVNNPAHEIYFKLKEILLQKKITSQVIYKDNPAKSAFKFHLPNIATALLAKIDGIPWQLQNYRRNSDLIIGVGAFKSEKIGKRYIGSAFCFDNDGIFKSFDCYKDDDLDRIVESIRKALGAFIAADTQAERVIIHYYKTMSKKHSKKITDMLMRMRINVPLYIVTINKTEASDYVGFDTNHPGLMPLSGTYVKLGYNEFLLYNNSRYGSDGRWDYLFPVKVKLNKIFPGASPEDAVLRMEEVRDLLCQIYKFSRMYWKSVKQQNLPITIKYPEMVAEIVPHFEDDYLPEFGKRNLWFL